MVTTQECCVQFCTNTGSSTPKKTVAVWPLTSYFTNYFRQGKHAEHWWRCKDKLLSDILLYMDSPVLANQQRFTFINSVQTLDDVRGLRSRDGWQESQRNACYQHTLMMNKL